MVSGADIPPVDLRAVCLVRAMDDNQGIWQRASGVVFRTAKGGRMKALSVYSCRLYIVCSTRQSRAFQRRGCANLINKAQPQSLLWPFIVLVTRSLLTHSRSSTKHLQLPLYHSPTHLSMSGRGKGGKVCIFSPHSTFFTNALTIF
jgi:hypothetical protein